MDTENAERMLKALRLPTMRDELKQAVEQATQAGWSHLRFFESLLEKEISDRQQRRIARLAHASGLPHGKLKETLLLEHLPPDVQRQLPALWSGSFVTERKNVLLFGTPGTGKTHLAAAIGHQLILDSQPVLFAQTALFVQKLLRRKQELKLEAAIKTLDRFECVILDDIGYVEQSKEEMEVLFAFFAARYERKSIVLTSNLVFSEWERIFKDPMTTAAAIDRLVHHCFILKMGDNSFRQKSAAKNAKSTAAGGEF